MKPNYYTIHKNKSAKRLRKKNNKYFSLLVPRLSMMQAMNCLEIAIVSSQQILNKTNNKEQKTIHIANMVKSNAEKIKEVFRMEKLYRFKQTKRYIK